MAGPHPGLALGPRRERRRAGTVSQSVLLRAVPPWQWPGAVSLYQLLGNEAPSPPRGGWDPWQVAEGSYGLLGELWCPHPEA